MPPGRNHWRRGRWQADIAPTESFWGLSQARSLLLYGRHDKNGTPETPWTFSGASTRGS